MSGMTKPASNVILYMQGECDGLLRMQGIYLVCSQNRTSPICSLEPDSLAKLGPVTSLLAVPYATVSL